MNCGCICQMTLDTQSLVEFYGSPIFPETFCKWDTIIELQFQTSSSRLRLNFNKMPVSLNGDSVCEEKKKEKKRNVLTLVSLSPRFPIEHISDESF